MAQYQVFCAYFMENSLQKKEFLNRIYNQVMSKKSLYKQNIIACVWDFDKTLIPGYMQTPLFDAFGIDEKLFGKK